MASGGSGLRVSLGGPQVAAAAGGRGCSCWRAVSSGQLKFRGAQEGPTDSGAAAAQQDRGGMRRRGSSSCRCTGRPSQAIGNSKRTAAAIRALWEQRQLAEAGRSSEFLLRSGRSWQHQGSLPWATPANAAAADGGGGQQGLRRSGRACEPLNLP